MVRHLEPVIINLLKSRTVKMQQFFRFSVRNGFSPLDEDLIFSLSENCPKWLKIQEKTGIISGISPKVAHPVQYLLTVQAANQHGAVKQRFFLKVTCQDIIDTITYTLKNILSLRNQYSKYPEHIPSLHEILEYIYEHYIASEYIEEFHALVWEYAQKAHLKVHRPPSLNDFKKVIQSINPRAEKQLRQQLGKHHILLTAELTNREFRQLFQQGSQRLGVHPIAVWNYLSAPKLKVWSQSHLCDVLDQAAEAIIELRIENVHQAELAHRPVPRPYPPRG